MIPLLLLVQLVVVVIVVGFLLWLSERVIPMDDMLRVIVRAIVVFAVVLYVLYALGLLPGTLVRG